jgi:hypothetical protein
MEGKWKGNEGKNALNVQKNYYFAITFVKIHDNLDMSGQNKHTLVKHLTSYIVLRCQKLMVAGAETKVQRWNQTFAVRKQHADMIRYVHF